MLISCFCLLLVGSVRNGIWRRDTLALEERRFLILLKWFGVATELIKALYMFCVLMVALLRLLVTWWLTEM